MILYALLAIGGLYLAVGAYVFLVACVRTKDIPWFDREKLEKTPFAKFFERIQTANSWLIEHGAEDVWITAFDGLKLHGWWLEAENAKGTFLLAHGYRSTGLMDFGAAFPYFYEKGYNLLIIDQRAHGKSEGRVVTFGVKESRDVEAWIRFHNEKRANLPLLLAGMSMGASTMMYLSDRQLPDNVKGILADCGFTSPAAIIGTVFRRTTHLPAAPFVWVTNLFAMVFGGFSLYKADTRKVLPNSRLPVLIIHGLGDSFVPCTMGKESFAACREPKRTLLVADADHCCSFFVDNRKYVDTVDDFILLCMV